MADHLQDNLKPRIIVMGIGGAGGNAVNNMIRAKLEGVEFIVANTDAQALRESLAEKKLQLGLDTTQGLGAGSKPDIGRASAEEDLEELQKSLKGAHMVFVTAGMGGGTGTGAAPVIARVAREMGILTVGVVTKPFHFEGAHRSRTAEKGIEDMHQHVDTLIIIPNQNLFRLANDRTTFADAFNMADNVLYSGVRGVTDLMIMPGLINLDFADVRTVMSEMGKAMMGTGEAEGENRAIEAAEAAISNPLLDDVSMRGAKGVLINITGGLDMTLFEVDEAANRVREEVDENANIIFGSTFDERMSGRVRVSVVATGIDVKAMQAKRKSAAQPQEQMSLLQNEQQPAQEESERNMTKAQPSRFARAVEAESYQEPQEEKREGAFQNEAAHSPHHEERYEADEPRFREPLEEYDEKESASAVLPFAKKKEASRPSFLERLGLKRSRAEEEENNAPSQPSLRRRPQAAQPQEEDIFKAAASSPQQQQSVQEPREDEVPFASSYKPAGGQDENLEIPAFLRRKGKSPIDK